MKENSKIQNIMIHEFEVTPSLTKKIKEHIPIFKNKKIVVVGDVGVDEYVTGEVRRLSPEAPVPVLDVEEEYKRLGLAANVAQNIKSLGGTPLIVSIVGNDQGRDQLDILLKEKDIKTDFLISDSSRSTTRKTRIMAKHHHLVRVDYETRQFLNLETEKTLLDTLGSILKDADALIVQDYAKGVISPGVIKGSYQLAKKLNKQIFVDPHRVNQAEYYAGCDLIKPNFLESLALIGVDHDDLKKDPDRLEKIGATLKARSQAQQVVLTQGKEGMTIFNSTGRVVHVPTFAKNVYDVTGAGDTVISALTLGSLSGLSLEEACVLANFAAGVVVAQVGCVPCSHQELIDAIDSYEAEAL